MWLQKGNSVNSVKKVAAAGGGGNGLVAIGIDREKGSQNALRWAADHLLGKGQTVILIHVVQRPSSAAACLIGEAIVCSGDGNFTADTPRKQQLEMQTRDIFLTFHCYCTRKDVSLLCSPLHFLFSFVMFLNCDFWDVKRTEFSFLFVDCEDSMS